MEDRLRREELLAHREFVRALARRLVLDPDRGDDIAQEAMLAALEAPRPSGPLRRWLSGVVRNLAYGMLRTEERRRRREAARARLDRGPPAGDVVADLELHREVVEALLALEEPYRTTLLLHFFEDLPPREIAKRQGLPGATVRSHLKRGIERLRRLLDERHGGRAWSLALLPLAFPAGAGAPTGATTAGVAVMSAKTKVTLAALLLIALGSIPVALHWTARVAADGSHRAARALPAEHDADSEAMGGPGATAAPAVAVLVRVLGPGGAPVPAADVLVFADTRWREQPQGFALRPEPWFRRRWEEALGRAAPVGRSTTDADGLARLDVGAGLAWRVEARKAGFARGDAAVQWLKEPPKDPVEIRLAPGHALEGRVLDAEGHPVVAAEVAATEGSRAGWRDFVDLDHRALTDAEGRYRFGDLPSGDVALWAAPPGGVPSYVALVRVPDVPAFDIVLGSRGILTGRVTAKDTGAPLQGIEVRAMVDRPSPAFGSATTDAAGVYAIAGLPEGPIWGIHASGKGYVTADPEAPVSWVKPQIVAGETTVENLELVRTGALKGTVRGPEGPLEGFLVEAMCKVRYIEFPVFQTRTDATGAYRIAGLPPARYVVRVATQSYHDPREPADWLYRAPDGDDLVAVPGGGEIERSFLLEECAAAIEGRVVDRNGTGLEGARVAVIGVTTVAGPGGAFLLEGVKPGPRVYVSAGLEGYRNQQMSSIELRQHETVRNVVLRLDPATKRAVVGRVRPAAGIELREPYVLLTRITEPPRRWQPERHAATPDGSFTIDLGGGWPPLQAVTLAAGAIGAGLSAPVRVDLGDAERYEVDLTLTPAQRVEGRVVGEDGRPVAGACVSLFEPSDAVREDQFKDPHAQAPVVAVTDADGVFRADGLAAGTYWLRAWAPGFVDAFGEVTVPAAAPVALTLERAREIAGRVVTRDGKPIGRIHVWVQAETDPGSAWWRMAVRRIHNLGTNERGEFRVTGLFKGDYVVNIGGGSGGPNVVSRAFPGIAAGTTDLTLVVEPGLSIEGLVVNRGGKPLAGIDLMARIEEKEMAGDTRRSDRTGADGSFVITGLAPGLYTIRFTLQQPRGRREVTEEHVAAGSRGVVIEVDDGFAEIKGTLVDGNGRPIPGVRLALLEADRWTSTGATTDAAGRFAFDGAADRTYAIRIDDLAERMQRYETGDQNPGRYDGLLLDGGEAVRAGEPATLTLHEGAPVEGTVTDAEGSPLAKAWVEVEAGMVSKHAWTDEEGRFRIAGVPANVEARLRATHPEFASRIRRVPTGTTGVAMVLERGTVAAGRLVDAAGRPLAGVRLSFSPAEGDDTESLAGTREDGSFKVRLLDRDYRVTGTRLGADLTSFPLGTVRGGVAELSLTAK